MAIKRVENFGKPKFKLSEPMSYQIYDFFEDYIPRDIESHLQKLNHTFPLKGLKKQIGLNEISKGQWILYTTVCLSGQIANGGLFQFFENCPGLIIDVLALLQNWADPEFTKAYEEAARPLLDVIEKHAAKSPDACGNELTAFWEEFGAAMDGMEDDVAIVIETSCYADDRDADKSNWFNALDINVLNYVKENSEDFISAQ